MSLQDHSNQAQAGGPLGAALLLLCSLLVSSGGSATEAVDPNSPALEEVRPDSIQLQAFRRAIQGVESSGGAYDPSLPEQLLSLGLALQQEGRHTEAVLIFKRGAHLARINSGLDGGAQIAHIQGKIISHLALGELSEVDESQTRLFRIQRRQLNSGKIQTDALLQQAQWQRQAYNLGVGEPESSFGRLLRIWDLNRLALTTIIEREGDKSRNLLPPLNGMLQAQYLISSHGYRSQKSSSDFNTEVGSRQSQNRFSSYQSKSYEMGRSIIRAIYDIQASLHGENTVQTAQTRVMMGDWMWWHGVRDPAIEAYSNAIGELAELDDAQIQTEKLLGAPTALPDLDGVRALPAEVSAEQANFLVEFGVTPGGRVIDLVRLQETDDEAGNIALEGRASRLMRALRKTKFRPRFVDGEAIKTEKIVKAYALAY